MTDQIQKRNSVSVSKHSDEYLKVEFIFYKKEEQYKFLELISQKKKKNIQFDNFYKIQNLIAKHELGRNVEHYFSQFDAFYTQYLTDKKYKNFLNYFEGNFVN